MDVKKAYSLLVSRYPNYRVTKCFEYDSLFVFQVISAKSSVNPDEAMDAMRSVNKKTGEVKVFQPFDIPLAEYKAGKQIVNFGQSTLPEECKKYFNEVVLNGVTHKNIQNGMECIKKQLRR